MAKGKVAADEAVMFVPVRRRQGLARGVHQVHDFGAGLSADVFQQPVGVALGDTIVRCRQGRAQGRQFTENLRQHFVAMQGAQQVRDVEIKCLAVLSGQFAAVIPLGQMLQRPQQRRQAQCEQGQAAPTGSAGEGGIHEQDAPVVTDALCLGLSGKALLQSASPVWLAHAPLPQQARAVEP